MAEEESSNTKKLANKAGNKSKRRNNRQRKRPARQTQVSETAEEVTEVTKTVGNESDDSNADGEPKKRRRRGRRGGRRRTGNDSTSDEINVEEVISDSEAAADESDGKDTDQEAPQEPRHRPAEKRSEGRRRRRRGVTKLAADTIADNTDSAVTEGMQSNSAATLAAVDSDNGSDTNDAEALFATIPSAQTADAVAAGSEEAPAEVTKTATIEEVRPDSDHTDTEIDMPGITADGRAINDPRVDARPIGEITIQTAIGSVFGTEVFPDAPRRASTAARAANDPRGARIYEPAATDKFIEENEAADA